MTKTSTAPQQMNAGLSTTVLYGQLSALSTALFSTFCNLFDQIPICCTIAEQKCDNSTAYTGHMVNLSDIHTF